MSRKYPWKTADKIIEDVKRKIAAPISQNTFSDLDILAFADEEMQVAQVPSVMMYNEEFFVYTQRVPLQKNVTKYPIPSRAIGMKLRDIFYADENGSLYEMTRISPDDKSFFQNGMSKFPGSSKIFYLENNNVVISPNGELEAEGYLIFSYYLQPNQLVKSDRVAFISSFSTAVTIDNANLSDGDIISINGTSYTAKTSGATGNQFNIGSNSAQSAANLAAVISGISAVVNGAVITLTSSNILDLLSPKSDKFPDLVKKKTTATSNGYIISDNITITCTKNIDTNVFAANTLVDFLELAGGHKTKKIDVKISSISGDKFVFNYADIPLDIVKGDYICNQYECWIPQIPSDLHVTLVERTGERILASLGDKEGADSINIKIMKNEAAQGILIDNRTEGAPKKIANRHSILQYQRFRRW
jgi:hypothetical protein